MLQNFHFVELRETRITSMSRRFLLPSRSVTLPRPAHFCIFSSPVLVNNPQFFFRIYLFQFSTCFAHPCAHHQGNQLYICTLDGHLHRVTYTRCRINPLNPELNPIFYLLALLAHHFLHVSRIRVKSLTLRLLMSYIYIYIYIYIWSTYS